MKLKMAEMNAEQAGKMLRNIAEMTANNSKNWDNYETIATQMIRDAYIGGQKSQSNDVGSTGGD